VALILKVVGERIPARFGLDPISQVQVLCPMAAVAAVPARSTSSCNSCSTPIPPEQVERFGWRFAPGDKVMQIANDYEKEVFNGDVGTIDAIDEGNSELSVLFPTSEAWRRRQPGRGLWLGRARQPGAGLCLHDPQEPGQRIPGRGDSAADAALRDAAARPCGAARASPAASSWWWCWWARRRPWPWR
jgi:hypothetical protein